jgi:serine protease Do
MLRDGKPLSLDVALAEMPQEAAAASPAAPSIRGQQGGTLEGLTLESLNELNRRRFQVPAEVTNGLVVTQLEPNSAAARAGLRPGDVLLEVNRQKIDGVERFRDLYGKAKGSTLLVVSRQGHTLFLVVRR